MPKKLSYYFNTNECKAGNAAYNKRDYRAALKQYQIIYEKLNKDKHLTNIDLLDERSYAAAEIVITQCKIISSVLDDQGINAESEEEINTRWGAIQTTANACIQDFKHSRGLAQPQTQNSKLDEMKQEMALICEAMSDIYPIEESSSLNKSLGWIKKCIDLVQKIPSTEHTKEIYLTGLFLSEKSYDNTEDEQTLTQMHDYLEKIEELPNDDTQDKQSQIMYYRLFVALYQQSTKTETIAEECRAWINSNHAQQNENEQQILDDIQNLLEKIPSLRKLDVADIHTPMHFSTSDNAFMTNTEHSSPDALSLSSRKRSLLMANAPRRSKPIIQLPHILNTESAPHPLKKRKKLNGLLPLSNELPHLSINTEIFLPEHPYTTNHFESPTNSINSPMSISPVNFSQNPSPSSPSPHHRFFITNPEKISPKNKDKVSVTVEEAALYSSSQALLQFLKEKKTLCTGKNSSDTTSAPLSLQKPFEESTFIHELSSTNSQMSDSAHQEAFIYAIDQFKIQHASDNYKLQAHFLCLVAHYYQKSPNLHPDLVESRYKLATKLYQAANQLDPQSNSTKKLLEHCSRLLNKALPIYQESDNIDTIFDDAITSNLTDVSLSASYEKKLVTHVIKGILTHMAAESSKQGLGKDTTSRVAELKNHYTQHLENSTNDWQQFFDAAKTSSSSSDISDMLHEPVIDFRR